MNDDGSSKHYSTPVSASSVHGVIYQYELHTAILLWYIRLLYLGMDTVHHLHEPVGREVPRTRT